MTLSIRLLGLASLLLVFTGCGSSDGPVVITDGPPDVSVGGGHSHANTGPRGGAIIELGSENYHAELVDDTAANSVTIYLLGGDAKTAVAIPAEEITINIRHGEQAEQFKLKAMPTKDDPAGSSSRFGITDKHLTDDLHDETLKPQLVVEIDGKQYRGEIAHDHDHGHDHAGHDHDKEGHKH